MNGTRVQPRRLLAALAAALVVTATKAAAQAVEPEGQQGGVVAPSETGAQPRLPLQVPTVRVKDVARLEGLRPNQLVGLGLVVGLEGTGDSRIGGPHQQMVANLLQHFGVSLEPSRLRPRNVAAVMVTATLPALARPGDRIDATVSSLGDARSLAGGVLLQTPLQGADGQVYAVAQGALILGGTPERRAGFDRAGATVALLPQGALVERSLPVDVAPEGTVRLLLSWPDFSTAVSIVDAINRMLGGPLAETRDGSVIAVRVPPSYRDNPAALIAAIENLPVTPSPASRVVVSERTGTVVIGHQVRIAPVAVAHRGLSVRVAQAAPPAGAPAEATLPLVDEQGAGGHAAILQASATVGELVDALNALGASPRDIVAILQAIRAAGALFGELEVI